MTIDIKLSALEKKPKKRLERITKRYYKKIGRLTTILRNSRDYGIEVPLIMKNQIMFKIWFYRKQINKLNNFIQYKFPNPKSTLKPVLKFEQIHNEVYDPNKSQVYWY